MKAVLQLVRQPMKLVAGILFVSLAVAIMGVCVGQAVSAVQTEIAMENQFTTVAMPTGKYNLASTTLPTGEIMLSPSMTLPKELAECMDALATNNPDVVKTVASPGLASAYIPELKSELYTNHYIEGSYAGQMSGSINNMLVPSPIGKPYSCAMLEVQLDEILGPTSATVWDINTQRVWAQEVNTYHCVDLRATVVGVVGLHGDFLDPVGMDIILTLMLPDETSYEAMDLQLSQRYLVYGMDYFDKNWLCTQSKGVAGERNCLTLTLKNKQQLDDLGAEYAAPTIVPLYGSVEDYLSSPDGILWKQTLERITINNQAFPILGVENLNYIANFARGYSRIVQGRDFTQEELEQGANVCILAESLAYACGIAVGDTISLNYYNVDSNCPYQVDLPEGQGVVNPTARYFTAATPFVDGGEQQYTVVGLYRSDNEWAAPEEDLYAFTPNTVFVPKTSVTATMEETNQGLFRTLVLYNGKMEEFQSLAAEMGYGDLFLCDDQGYTVISQSMHDYKTIAIRALWIGTCLGGVILALFILLFPMSQLGTTRIMASLGATTRQRVCYVLQYCLCILGPGSILGFGSSILLWQRVAELLMTLANANGTAQMDMGIMLVTTVVIFVATISLSGLLTLMQNKKKNMMEKE